jgi:hypothetical protein
MSVLVSIKVAGDTDSFQRALADRGAEFKEIGERARGVGAIHHRFGVGDGFILVVDEWESADQFHAFFGDPALAEFIGSVGGSPTPPDITVTEAISSPDQF